MPPKSSSSSLLRSAPSPDQKSQLGARLGAKSDTLTELGGTSTDNAAHTVGMSNHADPTQPINDLLAHLGQALGDAVSRTDDDHRINPRLLTVEEAADYLGIGRSSVYRMVNEGTLPYLTVMGKRRLDRQ